MTTVAAMTMLSIANRVQPLDCGSSSVAMTRISTSTQKKSTSTRRRRSVRVPCMADERNRNAESARRSADGIAPISPSSGSNSSTKPPLPNATRTPLTNRKVTPSFVEAFAFKGPAPETINGRLAMLGFLSALGVELKTGDGLLTQINDGGIGWFFLASVIITYASLVPIFAGVTPASKSNGIFTAQAETWNGRLAMIGIVGLAITEYLTGNPLL